MREVVESADLFLNVSGGCLLRDEYMAAKHKVLIDTDPGWNHFVNYPRWDREPRWHDTQGYRAHDHFFTYAECIGQATCRLPTLGLDWHPTRPPVVTRCWHAQPPGSVWTTVMSWVNFHRPIEHDGVVYGTKEREFERIEGLPSHVTARLEVAVGGNHVPRAHLASLGWSVVDSHDVSRTPDDYRSYLQRSRAEFSVAKNVYVATHSGWFSCRSVCYLAAGRPVVVQDTGFSSVLPTGHGLFTFDTMDQAAAAINTVERDYERQCAAAREMAETYFDSSVVLSELLTRVGLGG
jgi:hypothetical protein